MNMKPIKKFPAAVFLLAGLLAGCAGFAPTPEKDITRAVKLVGPETEILSRARKTLDALTGVSVVPEDSYADLTLILRQDGKASKGLFNTKPPVVGVLRQQQKPSYLRLSYVLVNQEGEAVSEGEVVGMGPDKTGYFPSLDPAQTSEDQAEALSDALKQLKAAVAEDTAKAPFTSKVTTRFAGNNQVAVPVSPRTGLTVNHTFSVAGQPESELRFIGLTEGLGGSRTHALLETTKGPLPNLGDTVILK